MACSAIVRATHYRYTLRWSMIPAFAGAGLFPNRHPLPVEPGAGFFRIVKAGGLGAPHIIWKRSSAFADAQIGSGRAWCRTPGEGNHMRSDLAARDHGIREGVATRFCGRAA